MHIRTVNYTSVHRPFCPTLVRVYQCYSEYETSMVAFVVIVFMYMPGLGEEIVAVIGALLVNNVTEGDEPFSGSLIVMFDHIVPLLAIK